VAVLPQASTKVERSTLGVDNPRQRYARCCGLRGRSYLMNNIVYIVGLVVIVIAILSFFGFR
jgi:small-conductance mechanosensitive channel